jgi:Fe-S oxidoreductase
VVPPWQACPHCKVYFAVPQGTEQDNRCPACHQAIAPETPAPRSPGVAGLAGEWISRYQALAEAQVVPDAPRCVQCGCCSYNCPVGIDVRGHARRGRPIHDSHCLTCGECVKRCPRGVLHFERISVRKGE